MQPPPAHNSRVLVALASRAMQLMRDEVLAISRQGEGVRLVVPEGDRLELHDFTSQIAARHLVREDCVHIVEKGSDRLYNEDNDVAHLIHDRFAVVLMDPVTINAKLQSQILQLSREGQLKLLVAVFSSPDQVRNAEREELVQKLFGRGAHLVWPSISQREADVPIIATNMCILLGDRGSKGGRSRSLHETMPRLTPDALGLLMEKPDVRAIFKALRDAVSRAPGRIILASYLRTPGHGSQPAPAMDEAG